MNLIIVACETTSGHHNIFSVGNRGTVCGNKPNVASQGPRSRYSRMPPVTRPKPLLRWTEGLPKNEEYYWDKAVPTEELHTRIDPADKAKLPPHNMNHSNAWTAKIVETRSITRVERHASWPQVFASKGLHQNYIMKGQAAKTDVKENGEIENEKETGIETGNNDLTKIDICLGNDKVGFRSSGATIFFFSSFQHRSASI